MPSGSISNWLHELKHGNPDGAQAIWERYFVRLVNLARERIRDRAFVLQDEEDVALSVLNRFCRAAQEGRVPDITNRNGLWYLLAKMTAQKLVDRNRYQTAMCRTPHDGDGREGGSVEYVIGDTPSPEFGMMMGDALQSLFKSLQKKPQLRRVLIERMEGRSNEEIADAMGYSRRTVQQMVKEIQDKLLSNGAD